ncbi:DUF4245 domain-containing protein [Enteractinococcus coprophilus]|nr:DUF4245 domain-containing protein [Enteractinococcus coprophilus]
MSQTAKAMTYSVLVTLAIVLAFMALNPRSNNEFDPGVDVAAAQSEVANVAAFTPVKMDVPDTWRANYARWNSGSLDEVPAWNVGYLTEADEFFGVSQTANATNGWIRDKIKPAGESTTISVANHDVERWVGRDEHIYLVAEFDQPVTPNEDRPADAIEPTDTMTLIISGSMDEETLQQLAAKLMTQYR